MKGSSISNSTSSSSSERYSPSEIEAFWQKQWISQNIHKTSEPKPNQETFYALSMFPYPSGTLHMGHVRNYVITDVIARFKKMQGAAVLHPMGWDAFGLPAENAAIERGINPSEWTYKNIDQMRGQLKRLGLSIDWSKEIATADKGYYKWTQYIFNELHKNKLAYRKNSTVNWDPIDKTVLANEQVDNEGKSWRSGAIVEKKELNQWFLKTTAFAEDLDNDLCKLHDWPDRVKTMQKNWIGRSVGAEIRFKVYDNNNYINVFTTRPETVFGVTYIVLSSDHPLVDQLVTDNKTSQLQIFRSEQSKLTAEEINSDTREKKGMSIGAFAVNPANQEIIPIWVGDYVIYEYGTGAVMGVPAHDKRDFIFANKYSLSIKFVIKDKESINNDINNEAFIDKGIIVESGKYNGLDSEIAKNSIVKDGINDGWARFMTSYKLRDWLISRQRYWGCPIPIIHCKKCGEVRVPTKDLPVILPTNIELSGKGQSPLLECKDWLNVKCPICNSDSVRESDTMDTFICSSWYYLRYLDPSNSDKPFASEEVDKWLPVKQYVGGIEHAILHLLYSRFITKALKQSGLININEPFEKLLTQGMVQAVTYKNPITAKYYSADDLDLLTDPRDPNTGEKLEIIYEKMSKSKYNGIDPGIVIDKYGADTARLFILFKAPPEKDLEWDDSDVEGQYRFIQRIWKLINRSKYESNTNKEINVVDHSSNNADELSLKRLIAIAIKEVTEDINNMQFNTAISELMKLSNYLSDNYKLVNSDVFQHGINILLLLMAPFAPHLSEELWKLRDNKGSIHLQEWPKFNPQDLELSNIQIIIQINGKVRGTIPVKKDLSKEEITNIALDSDITKKWLKETEPRRIIVVPNKLINFVI